MKEQSHMKKKGRKEGRTEGGRTEGRQGGRKEGGNGGREEGERDGGLAGWMASPPRCRFTCHNVDRHMSGSTAGSVVCFTEIFTAVTCLDI